jgi:ATP-dependent Lon protease
MRKRNFSDAINRFFKLGNNLNQRDTIAVKRTVSGLLKLLYPHGEFTADDVADCLRYALESRRRVKEQLKKIGGMEFFDVHFSYIENESLNENFISLPEQGGDKLIPESALSPGALHTIAAGSEELLGLYRLELQVTAGTGKLSISGVGSNSAAKESIRIAFDYFRANVGQITSSEKVGEHDFHLHIVELNNTGATTNLTIPTLVSLCSGLMKKTVLSQSVVLGGMSLGGSIIPVTNLAETLQVAFDAGAKKILIPVSSVGDIATVPGELFAKFQTSFYATPADAVFKALGVD